MNEEIGKIWDAFNMAHADLTVAYATGDPHAFSDAEARVESYGAQIEEALGLVGEDNPTITP